MKPCTFLRGAWALLFAAAMTAAGAAHASPKQVRLVVPFTPGGNIDTIGRLLAEQLEKSFGVAFVENRPGANGNIGADNVYKSPADGSALLVAPYGPISVNQHLYAKLSYDPAQWVPVSLVATVPNVLAVHPSLPVNDLKTFIDYLKAHPGEVTFASQGSGSSSHLAAELFMQLTGTEMLHVPYKGTGPALVDLIGGQVKVFFDTLSSSGRHHKSGKVRVLAVADEQRSALLPEVPTFAESGPAAMKDMLANAWYVVVAPPKTPQDVVEKFEQSIRAALATPAMQQKFVEMGISAFVLPPEQTKAFIDQETAKWGQVIRKANITVN